MATVYSYCSVRCLTVVKPTSTSCRPIPPWHQLENRSACSTTVYPVYHTPTEDLAMTASALSAPRPQSLHRLQCLRFPGSFQPKPQSMERK